MTTSATTKVHSSWVSVATWLFLVSPLSNPVVTAQGANGDLNFNRIATYNVCQQIDDNCNTDTETVAEIVTITDDGNTAIYTDGPREAIGTSTCCFCCCC